MNPFSKSVNPAGKLEIIKMFLTEEIDKTFSISRFALNFNTLIGQEITIYSSRSDVSDITNPSCYNTPRLEDEKK